MNRILQIVALPLLLTFVSSGQEMRVASGDLTIDPVARTQAIDGILRAIRESYVYPEIGEKMERAVRERQERGEYNSVVSGRELARLLTEHLRSICNDKHLGIGAIGNLPPGVRMPLAPPTTASDLESQRVSLSKSNFGFPRAERLAGNIGFLEIRAFNAADLIGDTVAGAMTFLANTDAIIVDVRENAGGYSAAIALVSSYLFGPEPVHLNDVYWRPSDSTHQWWTLPYVPGRRLATQDVYVLTSSNTFSAAEEFACNLKVLKRATIVGEQTAGGAHPIRTVTIMEHFLVMIPAGRAINPVSKTDWEGVGVEPDIRVPAGIAFQTAHLKALEKAAERLSSSKDATTTVGLLQPGNLRAEIDDAIRKVKAELSGAPQSKWMIP